MSYINIKFIFFILSSSLLYPEDFILPTPSYSTSQNKIDNEGDLNIT
jgi:hypothetical protein